MNKNTYFERLKIAKNTIRQAITIQELIEHITGQQFKQNKICCPFHNEKDGSFFIKPVTGVYHCLGCGESGDIFTFVSKYYNMDFRTSIEWIDNEYHLGLLNGRVSVTQQIQAKKRLLEEESRKALELKKHLEYDTICQDYRIAHIAVLALKPYTDLWCYYINQMTFLDYLIEEGRYMVGS